MEPTRIQDTAAYKGSLEHFSEKGIDITVLEGVCRMCKEYYTDQNRSTLLLNPFDCLEYHTQYICGTCGRYICIEHDPNRGLQRWNFGRAAYKIFASDQDLELYLKKNKRKNCNGMAPVFRVEKYKKYPNTQIRKLTSDEIQKYITER